MGIWTWILLSAMTVLTTAPYSSEACSCIYHHPQSFCCNMDIVIKGQFLNETEWTSDTDVTFKGYNIRVEKMFGVLGCVHLFSIKAPEVFKGDVSQGILLVDSLAGTFCEYQHSTVNFYKDYLITLGKGSYIPYVDSCSFIRLWSQLSSGQIKGFQGDYATVCRCEVTSCFSSTCFTTEKECAFDLNDESVRQDQEQNQICAQNERGDCTWETIA